MFHNTINKKFCEDCGKELASKYSNVRRSRLRQSAREQNEFRDNLILKSLDESWVSIVCPPANMQTEESCLFMLNFNKTGDTMITSSVNVIDIWDFKTKEKRKSLTEHTEIVTCVEYMKSPKDDMLISCSLDKTMKIWKDYKCVDTLAHHQDWLRCMSISQDNQYLISGCVSSVIWGYDLEKQKPIFNIVNKDGKSSLNTINSLNFQQDSSLFLSGTRDGYIKLFDIRANPTKPIQEIYSHNMKLNSAVFGQNSNMILSAGRDSAARLWDLRMVDELKGNSTAKKTSASKEQIKGFVAEYRGHTSQGYNIASHFFFDDKYIITGSEDGYIYIYHTNTMDVVRKIPAGMKIIHLLKPYPNPEVGFAYSGLQKSTIHFYDAKTTEDQKPKKEVQNKVDEMGNDFNENTVKFIEDFMSENGDLILKVFHSNNITYSSGMTWDNLLKVIQREEDEDSRRLVRKLNEVLVRNMQQYLQDPESFGAREQASPTESQDTSKKTVYREIDRSVKSCPTCQDREHIKMAEMDDLSSDCQFLKDLP